jgi:AcrR family transcriptional regulator
MATPRRDAGRPRGRPIEQAIVAATLDELARYGLEGMSVPRVAAAAQVNKTTVYRRWPTREALVSAALAAAMSETAGELTDTGSLRGDLVRLVHVVATRMDSPEGRALARAALSESSAGAVRDLAAGQAAREQAAVVALVQRAAERGEWDPARHGADAVLAMLTGSVMHRVLMERQAVTPAWAETVVDVVVRGLAGR